MTNKHSKEYKKFTQEKYPWDSDMAKNITEKVTELIDLGNQPISVVEGFLHHLKFFNPRHSLPSQYYITLIPLASYNVRYHMFTSFVDLIQHVKQAIEEMGNKQAMSPCHFIWQCKKYKRGRGCVTLQLAVHEGLLSQCSITHSLANARKIVGQLVSCEYGLISGLQLYQMSPSRFFKSRSAGFLCEFTAVCL